MNITKCDRCGAIIEDKNKKYNNVFDAISEAIKNAVFQQITYGICKYVDGENPQRLDLCQDCQTSLNKWLDLPTDEKRPETKTVLITEIPDNKPTFEPGTDPETVTDNCPFDDKTNCIYYPDCCGKCTYNNP